MSSAHLPEPFASFFDNTSANIGIASDQIRLLACLLASIPVGVAFNYIPSRTGKHTASIITGLIVIYTVVGSDCIHLISLATIIYTLMLTRPPQTLPLIVFILTMSYLSIVHIHRLYTDFLGYKLEVSMLLMIAVPKLHMLACNIADGHLLTRNLSTNKPAPALHEKPHIHDYRKHYSVSKVPGVLEYYSYVLFFPTVLVGPVISARQYYDYIDTPFIPTGKLYGLSIALRNAAITGALFLLHKSVMPAGGYIDTKEFLYNTTFIYRLVYINAMGPFCRAKYYLVWYVSQAACIAAGYGKVEDKKTGTYTWDGACNAKALLVETSPSFQQVTTYWNIGVSEWLKSYVYLRAAPPRYITKYIPAKTFNNIVTKATSAFYHGFYLSYYLFFLSMAIVTTASEVFFKAFERYFVADLKDSAIHTEKEALHTPHKRTDDGKYYVWRVLCWIMIYSPLNILGMSFILLATDKALQLWSAMYYYGHVMPMLVLLFSYAWMMAQKQPKHATANGIAGKPCSKKEL